MKPNLIVMCGLQASGKSTKAKELQKEYEEKYPNQKTVILSSDQIRLEHPEIANDNSKVFNKLYADMNYWLRQGDNVIIDSTGISIKMRKQIFINLQVNCKKICYIMNTPYEECLRRLNMRNKEIILVSIKDLNENLIKIYNDLDINKITNEEAKQKIENYLIEMKYKLGE